MLKLTEHLVPEEVLPCRYEAPFCSAVPLLHTKERFDMMPTVFMKIDSNCFVIGEIGYKRRRFLH